MCHHKFFFLELTSIFPDLFGVEGIQKKLIRKKSLVQGQEKNFLYQAWKPDFISFYNKWITFHSNEKLIDQFEDYSRLCEFYYDFTIHKYTNSVNRVAIDHE